MANLKIQLATDADIDALLPLIRAYHEFEGIRIDDATRKKSVRTLIANKSLGGIWLVYYRAELVGYIALCTGYSIEFSGLDAFIDEFFISPRFRHQGIGTRVLDFIKKEANIRGIRAIHLEVARNNHQAHGLYRKANFIPREKYVLMSVQL